MDKQLTPQLICRVEDAQEGFKGFLVIDSIIGGHCAGGVRITPDVTEDEVRDLARSMTKKFGFLNIYMGGAKAGIRLPENISPAERERALKAFGRGIGFILKSGIYYPGTDMGSRQGDLGLIYNGAGMGSGAGRDDEADSGHYTGLAAITVAREIARYAGIDLRKCKVVIEGFGKVGRAIAREIAKDSNIVSISTVKGAIYNRKGLDLDLLDSLSGKYGDDLVLKYEDAERIDVSELLSSDADLLFLCGKPHIVTRKNAGNIVAKIVIGAGNLCFEGGAEEVLLERGKYVFPDFITSCGGSLGLRLRSMSLSLQNIERFITTDFAARIKEFINLSWKSGKNPLLVADDIVNENIRRINSGGKGGTVASIFWMLTERKYKTLASKLIFKIAPKKSHESRFVQNFISHYVREQFMSNKL